MGKPIPMVELWRGGLLESTHLGHAVLVDDTGQILQAWGDPERIIFPRSSCKMIQALPLVESGAAEHYRLNDEELALACASHGGGPRHAAAAAALQAESNTLEGSYQRAFHLRSAGAHGELLDELPALVTQLLRSGQPQRVAPLARWGLEAVDAIQHPAMTRQYPTTVFKASPALANADQ